MVTELDS